MNNYWDKRSFDELNTLRSTSSELLEAELATLYHIQFKKIQKEMEAFYDKLQAQAEDKVIMSDIYKYNRYNSLLKSINTELTILSQKEEKLITKSLKSYSVASTAEINKILDQPSVKVDTKAAKAVVDTVWCTDGKNYSDRIWTHKQQVLAALQKGLFGVITSGDSTEALIREIQRIEGTSYYNAKRLVRTEISYITTKNCLDRYKASGIKQYKYIATRKDKACPDCQALNGQAFDIDKAEIGINTPPLHPLCFCIILPLITQA